MNSEEFLLYENSVLKFNISTGEIVSRKNKTCGDYVKMYKGYTPYYNLDGNYIGFKMADSYFVTATGEYSYTYNKMVVECI